MIRSTRGLVTEALTEAAQIISGTVTDDGGGGGTVTTVTGGTIACRIDTLTGGEGEVAQRISDRSTHLVTLPLNTAVSETQDLAIAGRGTFEVTAVREHTDDFSRMVEVVARD